MARGPVGAAEGEAPTDYARFYFMNQADAEAFRRRWGA